MSKSQPIATAPRDGTKILAYGTYGWGTLDNHTARGWLVVEWVDDLCWDEEGTPIGGWRSITDSPYKDYMIAEKWAPLPED